MMKKDISANLYQKCLILCSKILLDVLVFQAQNHLHIEIKWVGTRKA